MFRQPYLAIFGNEEQSNIPVHNTSDLMLFYHDRNRDPAFLLKHCNSRGAFAGSDLSYYLELAPGNVISAEHVFFGGCILKIPK